MHLKRNDTVIITRGDEKGSTGKVLRVLRDRDQVIVQGRNLVYKHLRRSQKNPQGGRVQKEAPIHVSRVALVDPKTGKPTRVGFRIEDGKRVRYAKKSGQPV